MILGIDVSHHQGAIDMAAVRRSGRDFAVLKATEGTGFVDDHLAGYRHDAHAAGLVVGLYHFARAGNAAAEAAFFVKTIGALAVGEFVVLDWEVATTNPVAWCKAWLDAVATATATGVKPLMYLNRSTRDGYDWSPVIAGDYGLWLAAYDGATTAVSAGKWPTLAMKQYSDRGTVPGIAGGVDLDVFYGDRATLLHYGKQPAAPTPAPATTPAVLPAGSALGPGQILRSGGYTLDMQRDGNLVVYGPDNRARWSTGTQGHPGARLVMQTDGNAVVYLGTKPLWNSRTPGKGGNRITIQADGNLVIYTPAGKPVWSIR